MTNTRKNPRRRQVFCKWAVVLLLCLVGMAAYLAIDYRNRLARGFKKVEEVRTLAEKLGGRLEQGQVDGNLQLHLEDLSLADRQLEDFAQKLQEFPPTYLDHEYGIELFLSGNAITDRGVSSLARVQKLIGLDLSGTSVTDAGIEAIRDLDLQTIELRNTGITDGAIPALAAMQSLWRVDLENTAVSPGAQRKLADALPHWPDIDAKAQSLLATPPASP